jgi:hypothetical protein
MMAARGNAANKMKAEKKAKEKAQRDSKSGDGLISAEDLEKFQAEQDAIKPNKWLDPEYGSNPISRAWMRASQKIRNFAYGDNFGGESESLPRERSDRPGVCGVLSMILITHPHRRLRSLLYRHCRSFGGYANLPRGGDGRQCKLGRLNYPLHLHSGGRAEDPVRGLGLLEVLGGGGVEVEQL